MEEIKVIPEFNENMEIVAITIKCDNEGVLNMLTKERMQELLNKELGEQYNIQVTVTEQMFEDLQDNGIVKTTLKTETLITEENTMLLNEEDVDLDEGRSSEKKTVLRTRKGFSLFRKVNKPAYEILLNYLEKNYIITEAIIRRGMSAYKTVFTIENMHVMVESYPITPIEVKLLDKINDSVEVNSTGMDSRNVVYMEEQRKDNDIFLILEVEFPDGNVTGKYKLETKDNFKKRYMDISF